MRPGRIMKLSFNEGKRSEGGLSPGRLSAYVGLCLGAAVLVVAALTLLLGDHILNAYGKGKIERAFDRAYPGRALRIGELDYSIGANRLTARSVELNTTNSTLRAGRISLTGVRWARLLFGKPTPAHLLAKAGLDASDIEINFTRANYGFRCARLRASVPGSELIAEGADLSPLTGDKEIFSASAFRTTRFHVIIPECRVSSLDFGELIEGKSYRAGAVTVSRPLFDALVDRDKPVGPLLKRPLMAGEALAAIRKPLRIDSLNINDGRVRYAERVIDGADPGVITISTVNISVEGLTNRGKEPAAILLRAQGSLMDAGLIKLLMTIPVHSTDLSFHYSGSLGAMDLTRLDAFLDIAEHLRIKSGSVQELTFDIDVASGRSRGRVLAVYRDLKVAVRDKRSGSENGLGDQLASFLMNTFKIQNTKVRNASGAMGEGRVNYTRKPGDEFMQFVWFSLRSGILSVISL